MMKISRTLGMLVGMFSLCWPLSSQAEAGRLEQETDRYLGRFADEPAETMNTQPPKWQIQGDASAARQHFFPDEVASKRFLHEKMASREEIQNLGRSEEDAEVILEEDNASHLVDDGHILHTLEAMEEKGLLEGQLDAQPWSADYWATYKGGLGSRYADPAFPHDVDWKKNQTYITEHPLGEVVSEGNVEQINFLSPAEKYDLLVGDMDGNLTAQMWADGAAYYEREGEVETWFGICHGWAPAAYMLPRPSGVATVLAADGKTELTFYPSDIKALASLLWANAQPRVRFVGGRCYDEDPEKDENGRIIPQGCFDTNPATWHKSIVGQIGSSKRGIVIDATFDYEVWNQPVYSYRYVYFNPKTKKRAATLAEATVALEEWEDDLFKKYRSEKATRVIGIAMETVYVLERRASHAETNTPDDDIMTSALYTYDLELDDEGNLIGGEWYNNAHPDFIWTPEKDARAATYLEYMAEGEWQVGKAVPASWSKPAIWASRNSQPLAKVVEQLIRLSRGEVQ